MSAKLLILLNLVAYGAWASEPAADRGGGAGSLVSKLQTRLKAPKAGPLSKANNPFPVLESGHHNRLASKREEYEERKPAANQKFKLLKKDGRSISNKHMQDGEDFSFLRNDETADEEASGGASSGPNAAGSSELSPQSPARSLPLRLIEKYIDNKGVGSSHDQEQPASRATQYEQDDNDDEDDVYDYYYAKNKQPADVYSQVLTGKKAIPMGSGAGRRYVFESLPPRSEESGSKEQQDPPIYEDGIEEYEDEEEVKASPYILQVDQLRELLNQYILLGGTLAEFNDRFMQFFTDIKHNLDEFTKDEFAKEEQHRQYYDEEQQSSRKMESGRTRGSEIEDSEPDLGLSTTQAKFLSKLGARISST